MPGGLPVIEAGTALVTLVTVTAVRLAQILLPWSQSLQAGTVCYVCDGNRIEAGNVYYHGHSDRID